MGKDYDDDYPFKRVERPYEDMNQVGYYYKPTKDELQAHDERQQLYWWEQQNSDLSEWRKNYMRTLELRTLNPKRVLKLNVNKDVEKIAHEVHEQQKAIAASSRNDTYFSKMEIDSSNVTTTLVNPDRFSHVGIRSVAERPMKVAGTFAGGEINKSQKTEKTVIVTAKNNIDTLNYETPRNRSRGDEVYVAGEDDDSIFMDESPLQEKELFRLADMRLKEIFTQYAKNYS